MPAAAVIPALMAYIKFVAVKKLVVEMMVGSLESLLGNLWPARHLPMPRYFEKNRVFQAGICLHSVPWNNNKAAFPLVDPRNCGAC